MLNNRRWRPLAAARRLIMSRSDLPSKLLRQLHAEIGPWRDEHDPPGTCALLQSGLYINKPFKYRWDLYLVKLKKKNGSRRFTLALFKMLINNRSIYCRLSCHQSNDTVETDFLPWNKILEIFVIIISKRIQLHIYLVHQYDMFITAHLTCAINVTK